MIEAVIVTGWHGEAIRYREIVQGVFQDLFLPGPALRLYHGCATGVDTYAWRWAEEHGWDIVGLKADWQRYKKSAGTIRNQRMIARAMADVAPEGLIGLAFPHSRSRGTWDCVRRMRAIDIEVKEFPLERSR